MNKPVVSVIVPIYNAERYLRETLDSIKDQSFHDFEVIMIDDGSTDDSAVICDEYAKNDNRFVVYHIINSGVAYARNYGVAKSHGLYVTFVDADDLINCFFLEGMLSAIKESNERIVTCTHIRGKEVSRKTFEKEFYPREPEYVVVGMDKYRYTNRYAHNVVWGALYERNLLKGTRFNPKLSVGEDTLFFAELLKKTRSLAFVDIGYYYYSYNENSLAHGIYRLRHYDEVKAWEGICHLFRNESKPFMNECKVALFFRCEKNYINAMNGGFIKPRFYSDLHKKMRSTICNVFRSKELSCGVKMKSLFFVMTPCLYRRIQMLKSSKSSLSDHS